MIKRYTNPNMERLFSDQNRFDSYLKVEIAATHGFVKLGKIPEDDYLKIKNNARVDVKRIREIEAITHHDVVAFTRQISETLGPERKWIHYSLTSTDVVDTALGYIYARANDILCEKLHDLHNTLRLKALEYKNIPCIGRTHGMHADITSFGLKFALYYDELSRGIDHFKEARKQIEVGKISGAVGNFANVDPRIQDFVCAELNLTSAKISTQVLQRDRHEFYGAVIAIIGSTLEKIATEIRNLSRTEIHEVEEGFTRGQKGSSAMPQKRNPIGSENICGCARMLRGYLIPLLEDNALYHERDISHSSVERVALIDMIELFDYMLTRMNKILKNLTVFPENMKRNIALSNGSIFAQRIVNAMVEKGFSRESAYDFVQPLAMNAALGKSDFFQSINQSELMQDNFSTKEIDELFDYSYYLRNVDTIYQRVGLK